MRHRVSKKRFDRHTSHRKAMFRNMVTSLIEEERITTTVPKAKELRRVAERMVTLAKDGSLHARRLAAAVIRNKLALSKLFSELGPRFVGRSGGYTRILKLGHRLGDGADMAFIEYLGFQPKKASADTAKATKDSKAKPVQAKTTKAKITKAPKEKTTKVKTPKVKTTKKKTKEKE